MALRGKRHVRLRNATCCPAACAVMLWVQRGTERPDELRGDPG